MTERETSQLVELVGGARDGDRMIIQHPVKRIHFPGAPSYRRTGERTTQPGGETVHYFEVEE